LKPVELPEGITPTVERVLKSRKKSYPNQSEKERWKDVYRILFPNEDVPSPCKFRVQSLSLFSITHIVNHTADFEPVQEEPAHILDDYEEYSGREMPKLFRSLLETHFNTVQSGSETWKKDLVSTVEYCHKRILSDYRSQFATHPTTTTSTTIPTPASTTTVAYAPTSSSATPCSSALHETRLKHPIYSLADCTTNTDSTSHGEAWSPLPEGGFLGADFLPHDFDWSSEFWVEPRDFS
jgi:hypothetical protein